MSNECESWHMELYRLVRMRIITEYSANRSSGPGILGVGEFD